MRQRISITAAAGRTVQAAQFVTGYPFVIIAFTDDTFSVIEAWEGYEGEPAIMDATEFDFLAINNTMLVEMDVVSPDELDELRRQRESEREKREWAEYERLKRKYSGELE